MFDKKDVTVRVVMTYLELKQVWEAIDRMPDNSSFINGVPTWADFYTFFANNDNNVLYIVEHLKKFVGYGYVEYETPTVGKCHWGLAEYTPFFFVIIKETLEYIKHHSTLINIFAPIYVKNRVAKKIAKRLGYEYCFTMEKYFGDDDFEFWRFHNKNNKFTLKKEDM